MRKDKRSITKNYIKFSIFGFILLLFYVWQKITVIQLKYKISELKNNIENYKNDNHYVRVKINKLTSLKRIDNIAKKEFGFIVPEESNIIRVADVLKNKSAWDAKTNDRKTN